jgi:hypothetical protein
MVYGSYERKPTKGARARIFDFVLSGIALLPDAQLVHGIAPEGGDERLFDFPLNRINTNMRYSGSHAFADIGRREELRFDAA